MDARCYKKLNIFRYVQNEFQNAHFEDSFQHIRYMPENTHFSVFFFARRSQVMTMVSSGHGTNQQTVTKTVHRKTAQIYFPRETRVTSMLEPNSVTIAMLTKFLKRIIPSLLWASRCMEWFRIEIAGQEGPKALQIQARCLN